MSGPIQVIPPGLLGFFQLKNMGRNPSDLVDSVQPSLEMFDWYMQARAEYVGLGNTGGVPNATTQFRALAPAVFVPDGEFWYIVTATLISSVLVAGDSYIACIAMRDPTSGFIHVPRAQQGITMSDAIAGANTQGLCSAQDWFAPSGVEIGVFLSRNLTAATITYSLSATRVVLPV